MNEVVELSMDIADDNDGLLDPNNVGFFAYKWKQQCQNGYLNLGWCFDNLRMIDVALLMSSISSGLSI